MSIQDDFLPEAWFSQIKVMPPYDDIVCEFLHDLSTELLHDKNNKSYPDVMSFAFWCRKTNVAKLKEDYQDGKTRLGLGTVFHITPANVAVNFAYSWVFGLLAGNANIVRLPSKDFTQVQIICNAIKNLCDDEKYSLIKNRTAFLKYQRDSKLTEFYSARCQARMIWGGDQTVEHIKQHPTQTRGVDLSFADRYSFCIMDTDHVLKLDPQELANLATQFYNDTYLMDQQACSSPHLIAWLGHHKKEAQAKFWNSLFAVVSQKYDLKPIQAVDKLTQVCEDAINQDQKVSFTKHGNVIFRSSLSEIPNKTSSLRGKHGHFYELEIDKLDELTPMIDKKFQTLTYFGIDALELKNFVLKNRLPGIDRIVPIGKSLEMSVIWDGYDVIKELSRIIDIT